jgi:hypothetical protein
VQVLFPDLFFYVHAYVSILEPGPELIAVQLKELDPSVQRSDTGVAASLTLFVSTSTPKTSAQAYFKVVMAATLLRSMKGALQQLWRSAFSPRWSGSPVVRCTSSVSKLSTTCSRKPVVARRCRHPADDRRCQPVRQAKRKDEDEDWSGDENAPEDYEEECVMCARC